MRTHQTHFGSAHVVRLTRRAATLAAVAALGASSALVLGTSPALASQAAGVEAQGGSSRTGIGLRARIADVINAGVPGVAVRIQDGGTRVAAAGVADLTTGAALRPQARFRVGSVTKTFVATVALQLVGEGRLGLDDPVARRLPGLLARGNRITVRQLLNHTSGLFDYMDDSKMPASVASNRVFRPTELIAIAERHHSLRRPGASFDYSNTNYIVAGLLIEAVTHHQLGQELQRRIFAPLHLTDTSFPVASARIDGYHAHGYVSAEIVPTPDGRPADVTGLNPSAAWAAGAAISTAADLASFYQALMHGRLLSSRLLRDMKTTVAQDPADPSHFRYGLGIERVQDPCGVNWGHGGNIVGYQSAAYWNDQTGRTTVVASTMSPAPKAAETALSALTDFALCQASAGTRSS